MAMKDKYINKFGSKLLVASQGSNRIPQEYLQEAFNCRSTGAGIIPRRGKEELTNSILGVKNRGGFVLGGTLYQVTNSKIYSVDTASGVQTEIATLGYDARVDVLTYGANFAIIASEGEALKVFNGTTVVNATAIPAGDTGGIIEFINSNEGYTLYAINNILYISRPITPANPEYAYDFTGALAQTITYKKKIVGLKTSLSGVFIFIEGGNVEFIGSGSLQNVGGSSPTFLSQSVGTGGEPVNNLCISASGDKIFYITKNRGTNTINYIQGTDGTKVGELSQAPVIGVSELFKTLDTEQPDGFSFYNATEGTMFFHLRSNNSQFNDTTVVYDLINNTWSIDTQKNYNYVVKSGPEYFGFSDLNSSIYKDDVGFSDAGVSIPFKIKTFANNYGTVRQKQFGGMMTAGQIGSQTTLDYKVLLDQESVFQSIIEGTTLDVGGLGEIGGQEIGGGAIGGDVSYTSDKQPFERMTEEDGIYDMGTRVEIEISSSSQIQDFVIDILGVRVNPTAHIDINNKF